VSRDRDRMLPSACGEWLGSWPQNTLNDANQHTRTLKIPTNIPCPLSRNDDRPTFNFKTNNILEYRTFLQPALNWPDYNTYSIGHRSRQRLSVLRADPAKQWRPGFVAENHSAGGERLLTTAMAFRCRAGIARLTTKLKSSHVYT
jgi:hypothetical protein